MNILAFDATISKQVAAWGKPQLTFWNAVAGYGIFVYLIPWIVLIVNGTFVWWHIPFSLVVTYLVMIGLQKLIGRERPAFEGETGYKMWIRTKSCPSGHATEAALTAALFCFLQPSLVLSIAAVIIALIVGMSRVVMRVHYMGDVLVGWVLGAVMALMLSALIS